MAVPAPHRTYRFFLHPNELQKDLLWKWCRYSAAKAASGAAAILAEIRADLATLTDCPPSPVADCALQQQANTDAWIAQQSAPRASRTARGTVPTPVFSAKDVMQQPMDLNAALPR